MAASFGAGATDVVAENFHETMGPLTRSLRDLVMKDMELDQARHALDDLPSGVSLVGSELIRRHAAEAAAGGGLVVTIPAGICHEQSFVATLRTALPLVPPPDEDHNALYVLRGALEQWIGSLPESDVLIVWPDAGSLRGASEQDFDMALLHLHCAATSVHGSPALPARRKRVRVLISVN